MSAANMASICLLALLMSSVVGDECPYKECKCDEDNILCQSLSLTEVPLLIAVQPHRTSLNMQTNQITTIPAGRLPANLTEISLSDNPITTIDDAAFADSTNTLATLSFSNARLIRVPDAFLHLRVLNFLEISDTTTIKDWNAEAMTSIGSKLQTLSLVNVSLNFWPTWMENFTQLTELHLSKNSISWIPDDALDQLAHSLAILYLDNNKLTRTPKSLSKQRYMLSLYLGYNRISNITYLPYLSMLSVLSLMYNKISDGQQLSNALRQFNNSLSTVDIFGNELTEIPDLSFLELNSYLDLSSNHISDPNAGALPNDLAALVLQYNYFSSIPIIFSKLPYVHTIAMSFNAVTAIHELDIPIWIVEVDLVSNLITELTDKSFPENTSITALNLMDNPIVRISDKALERLQNLDILNLQNSRLTRLPLALTSLTKLSWLDITESRYLVCTCMEKSLGSWILGLRTAIDGDCGVASINYFFSILVESCPD